MAHAATDFAVPQAPFKYYTLVTIIEPTRMCRAPHPQRLSGYASGCDNDVISQQLVVIIYSSDWIYIRIINIHNISKQMFSNMFILKITQQSYEISYQIVLP